MLALVFLARTAMAFQFQSIASTAPFLIEEWGIGYVEIGALIGLYSLPGVVIAFPGGFLTRRFGEKNIAAAGLALMIVGALVVGLSRSYELAFAGRLATGVGAVLFNVVMAKMVTDWFAGREIVTAMAIMVSSWPFGIGVGLLTQALIAGAWGWPWVMHIGAALCGVALALIAGLYRIPPATTAPSAGSGPAQRGLGLPIRQALPVTVAGLIWGFVNVTFVAFFSFGPLLLVEHGRSMPEAGSLISIGLWIPMAAIPIGGYLAERSGRPDMAIIVSCGVAGIVLLLMPVLPFPALLCAMFGLSMGPSPGAVMALPARAVTSANRAIGIGYFYTCYYAAMGLGPVIAGMLADHTGTASSAVIFGGVLSIAVIPALLLFRALIAVRMRHERAAAAAP